jgi:bifunctional DNase/RNase
MKNDVEEVTIKGVMPTSNGCAIFLGGKEKTFVIYVDQSLGNVISMTLNDVKKDRPLTHDLIAHIFTGLGVAVERVVINDVDSGTFFARIILQMQNELGRKVQAKKPILVAKKVLESVEDMTEILERILKQQN